MRPMSRLRCLVLIALAGCADVEPEAFDADDPAVGDEAATWVLGDGVAPPPALAATDLVPGQRITFTMTGVPAGVRAYLAWSSRLGTFCPPTLGGLCLGLRDPQILGDGIADGSGVVTLQPRVPLTLPVGTEFHLQAVVPAVGEVSPRLRVEAVADCGDGLVQSTEACDDGGTVAGDGCSSTCALEVGVCGDGTVSFGEQCDDGGTVSGDGCSSTCETEYCGDGVLQPGLGEACDDGGTAGGDGCDPSCQREPSCGDGVVDPPEDCDDGGTVSGDGCSSTCEREFCGDGVIQPGLGESCDDGGLVSEDGCSSGCVLEVCGDGVVQGGLGERCDDGGTTDGDGCSSACQPEHFTVTVESGTFSRYDPGGDDWDLWFYIEPDPYFEAYVGGSEVYASSAPDDTYTAVWNATFDVHVPSFRSLELRFWDYDPTSGDDSAGSITLQHDDLIDALGTGTQVDGSTYVPSLRWRAVAR